MLLSMNNFVKGVLVGVGIGLLVAPMRGEELRRLLGERINEWRGYLPENAQLNQYVQQVSDRVSQTGGELKDYAQQAVKKVKETGGNLGDLAQQATSSVKQPVRMLPILQNRLRNLRSRTLNPTHQALTVPTKANLHLYIGLKRGIERNKESRLSLFLSIF